jgi:hypothetical protein
MRIKGSLIFDTSSSSEAKNLRIEKVASLPTFGTPDLGRLLWNTTEDLIYVGASSGWTTIQGGTGGGGSGGADQAELDALETSIGAAVSSLGVFVPGTFTGWANVTAPTSLTNVLQQINSAIVPLNVKLTAIAALTPSADTFPYFTSPTTVQTTPLTSYARTLLNTVDASAARAALGLGSIGTDYIKTDGTSSVTANISLGSHKLTGLLPGTAGTDAINKAQFDAALNGLAWKASVRAATIVNLASFSSVTVIDGVILLSGDRVLVKNQTTASQNGVYVLNSGTLTRAEDLDSADEFASASVFVREGSVNADTGWTQTAEVVTVGSDVITWVQFAGVQPAQAGLGLSYAGLVLNVNVDSSSIEISSDILRVKAGGITNTMLASSGAVNIRSNSGAQTWSLGLGGNLNFEALNGLTVQATGSSVTFSGVDATTVVKGIASFNSSDFSVTAGSVSAVAKNADSLSDVSVTAPTAGDLFVFNGTNFVNKKIYFLYNGSTAGTTHTVTHNLGQKYCNVTVVDSIDEVVIPQSIKFDSANQLTVTFNASIACKVVVMGV